MPRIELIERGPLSPSASYLAFRAPYRHEAGQYVALSAKVDGELQRRYYSIASPPRADGRIEFCIRHGGSFGRHLSQLAPGQTVDSSRPAGNMRLLDAARGAVYFAAGTGVSPIRAILFAHLDRNPEADATLLLGARSASDLLFHDELRALADHHPGLRVLPTVSGSEPSWPGLRGRVTAHLAEALRGRTGLDAYFCGPPRMVADLRERLARAGIPDSRQCFERY